MSSNDVFVSSFDFRFLVVLFRYFLKDFEIVPLTFIITGLVFSFKFPIYFITMARSFYFEIFSISFLITFLSPEMALSITDMFSLLSRIIMFGSLQSMVLPVFNCCYQNMVTLLSWLVPTDFFCSYQCSLPNFTHFPLCMVQFNVFVSCQLGVSRKFCSSVE